MRIESPVEKESSLGSVVKVQQVIDFMVLSELQQHGRRYESQIDQVITQSLKGVGVNDSYLSKRLKVLTEKGHVTRSWDSDNRYNRFYKITDSGVVYFEQLLRELPEQVNMALKVYTAFDKILKKHAK